MKKTLFVLIALLALLAAVSAAGAESCPTNPYREEDMALAHQDWLRRHGRASYWVMGFSLEAITEPTFDTQGEFRIIMDSTAPEGDYTYRVQVYDENLADGDQLLYSLRGIEGDTFTLPPLVMPTDYRVTLFALNNTDEDQSCCAYYHFTLEPDASHRTLDDVVEETVSECLVPGDDWQTALNLHDWLTHHAYYDDTLTMYGPDGVMMKGTGVCDSYSKAYVLLLEKAGIQAVRVISSGMNHAWNQIRIGDIWANTDVTWDDPNTHTAEAVSGSERHHFFCISDSFIQDGRYHNRHYGYESSHECASMANSAIVRLDEEWPEVNTWMNGSGSTGTYTGLIREQLIAGNTSFDVEVYDRLVSPNGGSYDLSNSQNYAYFMPKFHLFALVQSAKAWQDGDGNELALNVTFNEDGRLFHVEAGAPPLDLTGLALSIPMDCFIYTGNAKRPVPTVIGADLTEGTDYTVTWLNNVEAGTATVTVSALGSGVTGSLSAEFTILPAGEAVCLLPESTETVQADAFRGTAFEEIVLPGLPVTLEAGCFDEISGRAVQITVPDASSVIDPLALENLSNLTLIAPTGLCIDGVEAEEWCAQHGCWYEEY